MPYIIETWDRPGSQSVRQSTRDVHLRYLKEHQAKLIACGAKLADDGTDLGGGLYVLDVDTRAEAEAFIAADPFSEADLFDRVQITRWRKAFVDGRFLL
jgi:uncharacterized protein YciI